jgi:hypothetical protein
MRTSVSASPSLVAAVVLAMLLAGCDPGGSLGVVNDSPNAYIVRVTVVGTADWHPGSRSWEVEPHTTGVAMERGLGTIDGTIDLLSRSCGVLSSWHTTINGTIHISEDGTATFGGQGPLGGVPQSLAETHRCDTGPTIGSTGP